MFIIKVLLVIFTLEDYSQNLRVKASRKQIILMKGITYYICINMWNWDGACVYICVCVCVCVC